MNDCHPLAAYAWNWSTALWCLQGNRSWNNQKVALDPIYLHVVLFIGWKRTIHILLISTFALFSCAMDRSILRGFTGKSGIDLKLRPEADSWSIQSVSFVCSKLWSMRAHIRCWTGESFGKAVKPRPAQFFESGREACIVLGIKGRWIMDSRVKVL